jgi:hypothetical protein
MSFFPLSEKICSNDIILDKQNKTYLIGDYFPIEYNEDTKIRIQRYLENERRVPYLPYETTDLSPEELNHLNYLLLSIDILKRIRTIR